MTNHLKTATILAKLLDNKFNILGVRFGIDPLLGLIPGGGDLVSLLLSLYVVWIGVKMKLPSDKLARMTWNVVLDFGVGLIPILGDIVDLAYKANLRNLEILKHSGEEIVEGEIVENTS